METWRILPETPLAPHRPASTACLQHGLRSLRAVGAYLHALPYGRNTDRADYRLVLPEGRGTCSTKHALLAAVAEEQGIPVRLTVGMYAMSEANTPGVGRVLAAHGLEAIPEAHCYLTYDERRVDVTRRVAAPQSEIRLHCEQPITPSQIGAYKLALHHAYLRDWLRTPEAGGLSFDALWCIREQCIAALSVP